MDAYQKEMDGLVTHEHTYWDVLAKTKEEKQLLRRIRKNPLGKLCMSLYAEPGCGGYWEKGDTFGSEAVYRIGYEIGHWYQDLEEYEERFQRAFLSDKRLPERYPDGITPKDIEKAEEWLHDAERILNIRDRTYF